MFCSLHHGFCLHSFVFLSFLMYFFLTASPSDGWIAEPFVHNLPPGGRTGSGGVVDIKNVTDYTSD